jgi:hypothetical protein
MFDDGSVSYISPLIAAFVSNDFVSLSCIERGINGLSAEERLRVRRERSAPYLAALEAWLRDERARLSRSASVAEPIDYILKRWGRFARFIDDGRICLTNNAAERALRGFAKLSHCATPLQVSVNIGSMSSSATRHGRPFRAIAALTCHWSSQETNSRERNHQV